MDYKIKLKNINSSSIITNINDDSKGFVISQIAQNFLDRDQIYIVENENEINQINRQITFFNPNINILNFYGYDTLPYDQCSPKPQILANRIKNLYNLDNRQNNRNYLILTSINNFKQKLIGTKHLKNLGINIQVKSRNSITEIAEFLIKNGFVRNSTANNVGEYAIRGGIIDIVLLQAQDVIGYRLDFFGDEIESIKIFDPITQLSYEQVKSFEILPTSEIILNPHLIENFRQNYRKLFGASHDDHYYQSISNNRTFNGIENWLPLFYNDALVNIISYLKDPIIYYSHKIMDLSIKRDQLISEYYNARILDKKQLNSSSYHPISPELLYCNHQEFIAQISKYTHIELQTSEIQNPNNQRLIDIDIKNIPDFALASRANKRDTIELMQEYLQLHLDKKILIAVSSEGFKERLSKIFSDFNINLQNINFFADINKIKLGKIALIILPCNYGFETNDMLIIGEQALFGERINRQKISKSAGERIIEESLSIKLGELVVHRDHGIGKFDGIHTISAIGIKTDMIKIIYGEQQILFVPVDNINMISRYGNDNPLIQLDVLGSSSWKNRRDKVIKKIQISAEELIKIAANRQLQNATKFSIDTHFYHEFKAKFGFEETIDQIQAINDVENDLQKGITMDRLICGDVGFGKTEVAMRASAIVCQQSQVAIIAPTTILVRQHYKNFCQRFAGTEIKIAQLSRLISNKESQKIKEQLASGEINIIIGTHSLLQKNIKFNNLSLLIIDEEQHFGVAQKEVIKKLKHNLHVLTLSATPIPRTLQMSMTGVKDLSIIATPPLDRIAVRNFVMPYDSVIVREAIMREFNRSGKVFFVVPRLKDIETIEPRLKIALPELKITHAHGKMTPSQLEEIMNDFIDGKIDVLISTTIIESGIDIATANTMIIYKAEFFGLAQLYQLRGRVGRGKIRGYCYFMLDERNNLSKEAKQKIEVMQNLDALGVGFNIASHDMDIRGSGNILGDEQSGHVRETGVELYQQLLVEAINKIKNNEDKPDNIDLDVNINVKLGISLLIPNDYMPDLSLRMSFYKKISYLKNANDKEKIINEMTDRFGKIPEEIYNLFEVAIIRNFSQKIGVNNIEANAEGILIGFRNNIFNQAEKLMELIFNNKNNIKLAKDHKVLFIKKLNNPNEKLSFVTEILKKLSNL
jgi:transcription-repair coupling factor (superfamily II helicase)